MAHLDIVLLKDACLVQLHCAIESRLPAHGHNDPVRLLALDDMLHEFRRHGQEEHLAWFMYIYIQTYTYHIYDMMSTPFIHVA